MTEGSEGLGIGLSKLKNLKNLFLSIAGYL